MDMEFFFMTMDQPTETIQGDLAAETSQLEMTPYIKEELKWTILNNRHKKGLGEIDLEDKKPTFHNELTEREKDRRERRKAQNRRAAERCRKKKQKMNEQLMQDFILEQEKTKLLMAEIEKLKREKEHLQQMLENHTFMCMRQDMTPNTTPGYDQSTTFDFPPTGALGTGTFQQELRDIPTPFQQDPFDETPAFPSENYLYPQIPAIKPETQPSCTMSAVEPMLPELDLPDDFSVFEPVSPENRLGRQSISEYLDGEEYQVL